MKSSDLTKRDGQGTLELLRLLPRLGAQSHLASAFLATRPPGSQGYLPALKVPSPGGTPSLPREQLSQQFVSSR